MHITQNIESLMGYPTRGYHWINDPIPVEHLKFFKRKWVSQITKSSQVKKFEERADSMIKSYNDYVVLLCGSVIEKVYSNKNFIEEMKLQRQVFRARSLSFSMVCFSHENRDKKNYSLT